MEIEGADVVLESCAAAIAAGDGREIWQHDFPANICGAIMQRCGSTDSLMGASVLVHVTLRINECSLRPSPCRQHTPNGQISNALGGKCIGTDGDSVNLVACDGGSTWEMQGNGDCSLYQGFVSQVESANVCVQGS